MTLNSYRLALGLSLLAGFQPVHAALTFPGCADMVGTDFKEVILVQRGTPGSGPTALVTDATLLEPVSLYVHKDGKVYWTERVNTGSTKTNIGVGRLRMFNPEGNTVKTLASFNVSAAVGGGGVSNQNPEYGLRSFTLDPNYNQNHFGYAIYMPRTDAAGRGVDTMLLSRFTLPTLDSIDMASEQKLIKMPWTPGICCHQGGAMDWDAQGNLYFTVGNNTENSDNYAPMDTNQLGVTGAPKDRATKDNQSRVANTMDWRGKIFRIKPDNSVKGYSIPAGNFRNRYFELGGAWVAGQDTTKILPEIYTLGHRNPYSLSVDKPTGWVTVGEVGPDASTASGTRGPVARDEFNLIRGPGFHGWPYFVGENVGYNMFNPATNSYGLPVQSPDSIYNNSPHNTGVTRLPPATPSILPEIRSGTNSHGFTMTVTGGYSGAAAVTGPIYRYDSTLMSAKKFPPHFNGKWIVAEGARAWVKAATLNGAGTSVTALDDFPGVNTVLRTTAGWSSGGFGPIALQFGSEGALYIVHYAASNFSSTASTRISRIEYQGTCNPTTPIQRVATPEQRDRLMQGILFAPGSDRTLVWPEGMSRVEAFDLKGKRVFSSVRTGNQLRVDVPRALGGGLLRVRFLP